MVKKDKKSKDAEKKARVAAKQSKKTAQKQKKVKSKGTDDSDVENIDLESVLEEYAKQVEISYSKIFRIISGRSSLPASPIRQSHRDSLRTSICSIIGNSHWFTFQCEGAFPIWGRVL